MEKEKAQIIEEVGPDLLVSPHILRALMELFAGDTQQALSLQDQLLEHLTVCHYCRTAVIVLLSYAQEYDRRNNNPEEHSRDLLKLFANISRTLDARQGREYERLAVYAETIAAKGEDEAAQRFPDVAAHLKICADCRSAVDATVASLKSAKKS